MPRNEIDYSKTIIYKIVCNDLNITDCYVGSTTDFKTRKSAHKSACNNEKSLRHDLKVYKMIRDNGGWDNWSMIQIEKFVCNDSNEAHARERYWYENMNAKLNTHVPNRTEEEWRKDNKDEVSRKDKIYREIKKDHFKEQHREYYIKNKEKITSQCECECGKSYAKNCKSSHLKSLTHRQYITAQLAMEPIQP
jgi:hypothetical protein